MKKIDRGSNSWINKGNNKHTKFIFQHALEMYQNIGNNVNGLIIFTYKLIKIGLLIHNKMILLHADVA